MTCKDCIHYEACEAWNANIPSEFNGVESYCDIFKDKSRFVELPCKVGDMVYSIYGGLGDNKKVVVDNAICFNIYDDLTIGTVYLSFGKLGVNIFLTREEAEKALKECEKK